jgi:hypothetical protein
MNKGHAFQKRALCSFLPVSLKQVGVKRTVSYTD